MRNAHTRIKALETGMFPPPPIGGVVHETRDGAYLHRGKRYGSLSDIEGHFLLTPQPCVSIEEWAAHTAAKGGKP